MIRDETTSHQLGGLAPISLHGGAGRWQMHRRAGYAVPRLPTRSGAPRPAQRTSQTMHRYTSPVVACVSTSHVRRGRVPVLYLSEDLV